MTGRAPRRSLGVHSSGRFDRSTESMVNSIRRLRKVQRGKGLLRRRVAYITGTEASGRSHDELDRILGTDKPWRYTHIEGRASGECWATWNTEHLNVGDRKPFVRQLSSMTWRRAPEFGGGIAPPVTALVVPLEVVGRPRRRRVYLIVVHMPLDNTELRAEIWDDVCRGLRVLVTDIRADDPTAEVAIEADWNKDYRDVHEREQIRRKVARPLRLAQGWDGSSPNRGGTHGARRLIDGVVASRRLLGWSTPWCWLLPDDGSSDHRPYAHTLRWPLLPKRVRHLTPKENP